MATASLDVLGGATNTGATSQDVLTGLVGDAGCKAPVAAATTANVTSLSGTLIVDGYQTAIGDRILVWQQSDATQNGIYNVASGAWTRAVDCDGAQDLYKGTIVVAGNGTTYAGLIFVVATANPITVGVTALAFIAYMFAPTGYLTAAGTVPLTGSFKLSTSGGALRWQLARVNSETGSNVGSDLEWDAYADDGVTLLGRAFTMKRSSRVVDFAVLPTIAGATFASTLTAFVASGTRHAAGIVPDPGATAGVQKMLREDASFAIPIARGGISALKITNNATTPNTQIDVTMRSAVIGRPDVGYAWGSNLSFTINLALNQVANGIAEATTKQNSTWYYLYAIAKTDGSQTIAGLATAIAPPTAPTLPTGYAGYEYIGAMYVNSSGNLSTTLQMGNSSVYSGMTFPSYTSGGSFSALVPNSATHIKFLINANAGNYTYLTANSKLIASAYTATGAAATVETPVEWPTGGITSGTSAIAFAYVTSGGTVVIQGWKDSVDAC